MLCTSSMAKENKNLNMNPHENTISVIKSKISLNCDINHFKSHCELIQQD